MVPFLGFAQFSFEKDNSDTAKGPNSAFEIVSTVKFTTVDSGTYRWLRTSKNYSDKINSAICDNVLCYSPQDDSASFFAEANSSFKMKCNFYPNQGCGSNDVTIKIFKPSDRAAGEIFTTFHSYSWCTTTGVTEVNTRELSLSPSPASDYLHVDYGSTSTKSIRVIDILGNVILEEVNNKVSTRLDISNFNKGLYFVSIQDGNTVSNKSFVKK